MLDYWVTLEYIKVVSSVNDPMVYITRLAHKSDQETWMNEVFEENKGLYAHI